MADEQQNKAESKTKGKKIKVLTCLLVGIAAIVLVIFFSVPLFLSSSGGTRFLLSKINQSVDGQVQIEDFSVGWFKGIQLTNLSYADDAGNTSVTVNSFQSKPKFTSLLTGRVKLQKTVIDSPKVYLKIPATEQIEIKTESDSTSSKQSSSKSTNDSTPVIPIDQIDLELINGSATVELIAEQPQTLALTNIGSKVQFDQAAKAGMLSVAMNVDDSSTIDVNGDLKMQKDGWTIQDGDFDVKISKLQLASLKPLFALAGMDVEMSGELNSDITLKVENNNTTLQADATVTDFAQGAGAQRIVFDKPVTVNAVVSGTGKDLQIQTCRIQSQICNLDCSGTLESMNYVLDADLAQTQQFVGQFTDMAGLLMAGDLSARGKVGMLDQVTNVSGSVDLRELRIQKEEIATPATNVQLDFDCAVDNANKQLRIPTAKLTGTPGSINISNLLLPMSEQGDKTLSMNTAMVLDLAKAWPFAQVFSADLKDKNISGQLDAVLQITTSQGQVHLVSDNSTIENLKLSVPNSEPFVQDHMTLNVDVMLDSNNQTIDIRKMNLQGTQGESLIKITKGAVKKKVSNARIQIDGDFQAEYDWRTLSAFASIYMPQGLVVQGKRNDTFHFDSQYPTDKPELMAANLNASGTVGFDKAQFQGLNFGPTEIKLDVKQGKAAIDIPDADVNGGKVRFSGDIDLAEEPMILRLRNTSKPETAVKVVENVKIDDVISAKLLQYLNPVFANGTNVAGTANLACSQLEIPLGAGSTNSIDIIGSIGLENVHLNSPLLGIFGQTLKSEGLDLFTIPSSAFTVKNGLVQYENMPMIFGSDFAMLFSGTIGLDQSLSMTVKIPSDDRHIPVPLGGTLVKPNLDMGKFIELQGKELIEQELKKQLNRLFE